jgi:L-iditol 2-dehydrogenase
VHTVRAFAAGLLDPTPLITHELALSEVREAFRVMASDPAVGKILLRP